MLDGEIHDTLITLKGKNIWNIDTKKIKEKAAEFIRMADRIAEGDSPELLRNAPNERKNKKLFLKEDRFEKSSGTYSSLAEAQKSKYAALAGKESEQSDNFFEKAYGLGTQKDMLQSQVKKEASQSKNAPLKR